VFLKKLNVTYGAKILITITPIVLLQGAEALVS